jgi:hypothetical protein
MACSSSPNLPCSVPHHARAHCSPAPISHGSVSAADCRARQHYLFHTDVTPDPPPLFFPADRHADKSHRPLPRPLFTLSPIRVPHRAHPSPHPLASCPHWPSSLSPPSRESRPPPPLLPSLSELYHPVLPLLIRPHIGLSSLSQCSRACPW